MMKMSIVLSIAGVRLVRSQSKIQNLKLPLLALDLPLALRSLSLGDSVKNLDLDIQRDEIGGFRLILSPYIDSHHRSVK